MPEAQIVETLVEEALRLAEQMEADGHPYWRAERFRRIAELADMLRVLDDRDMPAVLDLLDSDPIGNVFVVSRVNAAGLAPERLGAQLWGYGSGSRPVALCYAGANLVPVGADDDALRAFAEHAARQGRRCSSIVGPRTWWRTCGTALERHLGSGP